METNSIKKHKDWDWEENTEETYIYSRLLKEQGFKHAFFTRSSHNKLPQELIRNLNCASSIHYSKQVHGNNLINASNFQKPPWPEADGIIGYKSRQSLWIYSADCIPALIADKKNGFAVACHAGWKGVANRILLEATKKLRLLGSNNKNLLVALGPAISGRYYSVSADIIACINKGLLRKEVEKESINKIRLDELIQQGIINMDLNSKDIRLDIRKAAAYQLKEDGLDEDQISICPLCTFSEPNIFNSWRRDKLKASQWSTIITN